MSIISDKINIAKVSQYLALIGAQRAGLYGGSVNRDLHLKLYSIRKSVERVYSISPNESTLLKTSNYMYALCGPYSLAAQVIINAGGGGTLIFPSTGIQASSRIGWLRVLSVDFGVSTTDYSNSQLANLQYRLFLNGINRYLEDNEWEYLPAGGFRILIPGFDATQNSYEIFLDVKGDIGSGTQTSVTYNLSANSSLIANLTAGNSFEERIIQIKPNGFTYTWDNNFLFSVTWPVQGSDSAIDVNTLQLFTFRYISIVGKWICVDQSIDIPV